jgi:hypothetical protein
VGRFAPKYAPHWKQAIAEACCDHGLSAAKAVSAASRGELPGHPGLTFDMNIGTAQDVAKKERRRRLGLDAKDRAKVEPAVRIEQLVARHLAIIEHRTTQLEAQTRAGKLNVQAEEEGRKLLAWGREASALSRGIAPQKGTSGGARKKEQPDQPDPGTLAAELERAHRAAPPTNGHTPSTMERDNSNAGAATPTNAETEAREQGHAPSRAPDPAAPA